jgi:gas vesicle protein
MTMKDAIGYDVDDVLDLIGLRRRSARAKTLLSAIGLVALGAGVGACAGLLLAPASGRRLRQDVGDRLDQIKERMKTGAQKRGIAVDATPQQEQQA